MYSIIRIGFYSFLAVSIALLVGVGSDISAQGKGKGGGGGRGGGGGQAQVARPQAPQRQMPQMQRQQPQQQQMRQQAQRPQMQRQQMPQMQRPQMQRPQFERRQMQAQRPQVERRQMPQMQRQQMPQWNRQAQRQERPQIQRQQMPQWNRQAQRQERPQIQRGDRQQAQQDRGGRQARIERVRPQTQQPGVIRSEPRSGGGNNSAFRDRSAGIQRGDQDFRSRGRQRDGQAATALPGIVDRSSFADRGGRGGWRQRGGDNVAAMPGITDGGRDRGGRWAGGFQDGGLASNFGGRSRGGNVDLSNVNIAPFRERARELRQQARVEGWNFDERDFRRNVWEFNEREAWRDNVLRSAISVNLGYANDYYYIPPPAYPAYYGVNYEPWNYNIGYTYYDPYYSSFYVQPYSYAYQPYDYYASSYYYDDPYYIDDPYDDFLTVRIFSSNYGSNVISRIVGGLLAYGYDQGYRDGLVARQAGYSDYSYYEDPYVYYEEPYADEYYEETTTTTYSFYEPYNSYSVYENRRSLSKGYELGYQDALYGNSDYDPYQAAANIDLVSVYVGASWQLS